MEKETEKIKIDAVPTNSHNLFWYWPRSKSV